MLNSLSVSISVIGFFLIAFQFAFKKILPGINALFQEKDNRNYSFFFTLAVAWSIGTGLRGIVPVWSLFLTLPLQTVIYINGAIGLIGLIACRKSLSKIRQKLKGLRFNYKLSRWEYLLAIYLLIIAGFYLYRIAIPWGDHDETSIYGYVTKLISQGLTHYDLLDLKLNLGSVRSYLIQSADAQLFVLAEANYPVRLMRFVNILFCSLAIFNFLRLLNVNRIWSWVAVACFVSTPELSYLATSLKVDAVVMMFELNSLLVLAAAILLYFKQPKGKKDLLSAYYLSTLALLLALFSYGNRYSGIYLVFLCASFNIFLIYKIYSYPYLKSLVFLLVLPILMYIIAPAYLYNMIHYQNPIYPFKAPWPFHNGAYHWLLDSYKAILNIRGLPPVALQLYLIFALASGMELLDKFFHFPSFVPMASARATSMGWPYPLFIILFILPFFLKYRKELRVISFIFIWQFILWSLGFHLSRVFVASSILVTIMAVMIVNIEVPKKYILQRFLQRTVRFCIILALFVSLLVQSWWFLKRYWGPGIFFSKNSRYSALCAFLKTKDYKETVLPSMEEARQIQKILSSSSNPNVAVATYSREVIHILFKNAFFKVACDIEPDDYHKFDFFLVNTEYLNSNGGGLGKGDISSKFPYQLFSTRDQTWKIFGKR